MTTAQALTRGASPSIKAAMFPAKYSTLRYEPAYKLFESSEPMCLLTNGHWFIVCPPVEILGKTTRLNPLLKAMFDVGGMHGYNGPWVSQLGHQKTYEPVPYEQVLPKNGLYCKLPDLSRNPLPILERASTITMAIYDLSALVGAGKSEILAWDSKLGTLAKFDEGIENLPAKKRVALDLSYVMGLEKLGLGIAVPLRLRTGDDGWRDSFWHDPAILTVNLKRIDDGYTRYTDHFAGLIMPCRLDEF